MNTSYIEYRRLSNLWFYAEFKSRQRAQPRRVKCRWRSYARALNLRMARAQLAHDLGIPVAYQASGGDPDTITIGNPPITIPVPKIN